jgi:hypothetical protein
LNWAQPTQAVAGSGGVEATAAATAAMALASKIVRCSSGMIIWHRGTQQGALNLYLYPAAAIDTKSPENSY